MQNKGLTAKTPKDEFNSEGERFVHHLVQTGDMAKAAKLSGLPIATAKEILRDNRTRKFIQQETEQVFQNELLPMAIFNLKSMLGKSQKPDKTIADLCKSVLDRVGFAATAPIDSQRGKEKGLEDMSVQELTDYIAQKESASAAQAQPIAPDAPAATSQDLDMFE